MCEHETENTEKIYNHLLSKLKLRNLGSEMPILI